MTIPAAADAALAVLAASANPSNLSQHNSQCGKQYLTAAGSVAQGTAQAMNELHEQQPAPVLATMLVRTSSPEQLAAPNAAGTGPQAVAGDAAVAAPDSAAVLDAAQKPQLDAAIAGMGASQAAITMKGRLQAGSSDLVDQCPGFAASTVLQHPFTSCEPPSSIMEEDASVRGEPAAVHRVHEGTPSRGGSSPARPVHGSLPPQQAAMALQRVAAHRHDSQDLAACANVAAIVPGHPTCCSCTYHSPTCLHGSCSSAAQPTACRPGHAGILRLLTRNSREQLQPDPLC